MAKMTQNETLPTEIPTVALSSYFSSSSSRKSTTDALTNQHKIYFNENDTSQSSFFDHNLFFSFLSIFFSFNFTYYGYKLYFFPCDKYSKIIHNIPNQKNYKIIQYIIYTKHVKRAFVFPHTCDPPEKS